MRAGGSEDHSDIQVNLLAALKRRLRGHPCKPNGSDLLVRIDERTGRFPTPASPAPRRPQLRHGAGRDFRDPLASDRAFGRTDKRRDYQRLASLRHYVLIAQDAPRIEAYTRGRRGWRFEEVEGLDAALLLEAFGIELPLAEIYDGLSFPAPLGAPATPAASAG